MKPKLRIAFALLLVTGLGVITWRVLLQQEPVYQGRQLSFWLKGFELDNAPGNPSFNEAVEAVRQAGTNAFPVLLGMLQARDSDLKQRWTRLAQRQRLLKVHHVSADTQQWMARQGFFALGRIANSAVPSLLQIQQQQISRAETNSNGFGYVAEILQLVKDHANDVNADATKDLQKFP